MTGTRWSGPRYHAHDRKLVIAEDEATTVRHVFERYAIVRSMPVLVDKLLERAYRTSESCECLLASLSES